MKHLTCSNPPRAMVRNAATIAFSITNQGGEHYHCHAKDVTLQVKGGVVQMFQGTGTCFVVFDHCRITLRNGRHNVGFQVLAGAASTDGNDLTILAECKRDIRAVMNSRTPPGRSPRTPAKNVS